MKIELRLVIEYDLSDYDDEDSAALTEVQDVLHNSTMLMVANGGLSGNSDITVESWEVHTDVVED